MARVKRKLETVSGVSRWHHHLLQWMSREMPLHYNAGWELKRTEIGGTFHGCHRWVDRRCPKSVRNLLASLFFITNQLIIKVTKKWKSCKWKPSSCWDCVVLRDPTHQQSLAAPSSATSESSEPDLWLVHTENNRPITAIGSPAQFIFWNLDFWTEVRHYCKFTEYT